MHITHIKKKNEKDKWKRILDQVKKANAKELYFSFNIFRETYKRDLQKRCIKGTNKRDVYEWGDLEKRPVKKTNVGKLSFFFCISQETYTRDLAKSPKRDQRTRPLQKTWVNISKETCIRDPKKRPVKETYERKLGGKDP